MTAGWKRRVGTCVVRSTSSHPGGRAPRRAFRPTGLAAPQRPEHAVRLALPSRRRGERRRCDSYAGNSPDSIGSLVARLRSRATCARATKRSKIRLARLGSLGLAMASDCMTGSFRPAAPRAIAAAWLKSGCGLCIGSIGRWDGKVAYQHCCIGGVSNLVTACRHPHGSPQQRHCPPIAREGRLSGCAA